MEEGEGESTSSAARPLGVGGGGPFTYNALRNDIYERLVESGNEEAISNPHLRDLLEAHLGRLPLRYGLDLNMDRVEDVLLHQKILADAEDPEKRPIFHVRFMKCVQTGACESDSQQQSAEVDSNGYVSGDSVHDGDVEPNLRGNKDKVIDFEPCSKLEDLNLDVKDTVQEIRDPPKVLFARQNMIDVPVHEIIFSSIDKPKLLSQLSALLADIGLNIREAHVFSTTDGYSLDVFEVDGWPEEETDGLLKELEAAVANNEGSLSRSSSASDKVVGSQSKVLDWEIDKRFLKMGKRIARGSCGVLYRASYLGQDVAVKILGAEQLNEALLLEFNQEVDILRKVHHKNVVRFIGACTKPTEFCIVTEYMTGGNLYDYLHKDHVTLELARLLKYAIDIAKGMNYLHQNNIIHRDLKTANLLMDANGVVKVADFGVARFQNQEGVMTAETGTYRWMAPEVINHQHYDHKADVFSFAIVLWELTTSRVPYDNMSPLQAALGVRQGLRPEPPENMHPGLLDLMQRCWNAAPGERPSFQEITVELEELLQLVQASSETSTQ